MPDIEIRKWQAQTVDMILSDNRYEECFNDGVQKMTKNLGNLLQVRVTTGGGASREKGLFAIVKRAAKLSEEVNRQVSPFILHHIALAVPYNPECMEDRSGLLDDGEKEQYGGNRGFIVHKVLFPMVVRYGFDDAGKLLDVPVIIRKGTVIVMRSGERDSGAR